MFGHVLSVLMELRRYMGITAAGTLVLAAVYLLCLRFFRWNKGRVRLFGLFYGLGRREMAALSLLYLRCMFVLVCLIDMTDIRALHVVLLSVLGVLAGVLASGLIGLLREAVNSGLLLAGLVAGNLLITYMREIQFEWSIMAVYVLLGSFMMLYCLYFFMKDIRTISQGRWKTHVTI